MIRGLRTATLAVALISATSVGAQQSGFAKYSGDLLGDTIPDPKLAEGRPKVSLSRAYLPSAVDISALMPPPVQQQRGSCVSHALGYAARGYYAALQRGTKPGDPANTPSPAFLHTQIAGWKPHEPRHPTPELCETQGSNALIAALYLSQNGALTNSDVPISRICQPDVSGMTIAKNEFSINDFSVIYLPDQGAVSDGDLDKIKQSVAAGNPVVIGIAMFKQSSDPKSQVATLEVLKANEIYEGSLGANYGRFDTGHAIAIVGYDDGRQAFHIQNSWGTDWAEGGFGWLSYGSIKADLTSALVLQTGFTPPRPPPIRSGRSQPNIAKDGQCAAVYQVTSGVYEGFVETDKDLADLKQQYGAASVERVAIRPWPLCETLLTLDTPMGATSRPTIAVDGGKDSLKFGEMISFSVTTPSFPSFVYVVYLQADGTVVNLVPRRGPIRQQLAAGTSIKFGDGLEGRQKFKASAPAGSEAIIAIASRSPLEQLEALETGKSGQFRLSAGDRKGEGEKNIQDRLYLSLLRAALNEMPDKAQAAREVTAEVVHLTISAK